MSKQEIVSLKEEVSILKEKIEKNKSLSDKKYKELNNNLLEIFFYTHDPTTLNRQGADIGSQYRSIILYHNIEQKNIAEKYIAFLIENDIYNKKIVTELVKFNKFYPAENYHQNYYSNNQSQSYCTFVISPKLQKLYSSNFYEKYKK